MPTNRRAQSRFTVPIRQQQTRYATVAAESPTLFQDPEASSFSNHDSKIEPMPEYYVVSARNRSRGPAQGCFVEFEDLLVDCCNAVLISPRLSDSRPVPGLSRFARPLQVDVPLRRSRESQVLVIVGISTGFVVEVLTSIRNWRSRFDLVCAYVSDAWLEDVERVTPKWRLRLSRHWNTLAALDHLFIVMGECVGELAQAYQIPVSMLPMACDVLRYGSNRVPRAIDVMGYGRQHPVHGKALARVFNDPESQRVYYHTDHTGIGDVFDFNAHRRLFWKLLRQSKLALAYDALAVNTRKFPCSFVGQRWFECITAGCLIIGRRPTCAEMNELFTWVDSTVEAPEDEADFMDFVEGLLVDHDRLESAHRRNYFHALRAHDWRHRIASMHDVLALKYPDPLNQQLEKIRNQHAKLPPNDGE